MSTQSDNYKAVNNSEEKCELTFREAVFSRQFLSLYVMAMCSIFEGYYVLTVYKNYGQTQTALEDDHYLTQVGILAAGLNTIRFVWSAAYDHPKLSFKMVYGALILIQVAFGFTLSWAAQSRTTYAIWVGTILFTEGGHFVLLPTVVKVLYKDLATPLYSLLFTFTGLSNLLMILVVHTTMGTNYNAMFKLMSVLSLAAFTILTTVFDETPPTSNKEYYLKCTDHA